MNLYADYFSHTQIFTRQRVQSHSHLTFTHSEVADFYCKSLERRGWDSNPCFQSLVTSALYHYTTTPPPVREYNLCTVTECQLYIKCKMKWYLNNKSALNCYSLLMTFDYDCGLLSLARVHNRYILLIDA